MKPATATDRNGVVASQVQKEKRLVEIGTGVDCSIFHCGLVHF